MYVQATMPPRPVSTAQERHDALSDLRHEKSVLWRLARDWDVDLRPTLDDLETFSREIVTADNAAVIQALFDRATAAYEAGVAEVFQRHPEAKGTIQTV